MTDRYRYRLETTLTDTEADSIVDDALALLEHTGMMVDHDGLLDWLAGQPGVTVAQRRIRLSGQLVGDWLPEIHRHNLCYSFNRPDDTWLLVPPYMASAYRDPVTLEVRRPTAAGLALSARLCHALGMAGPSPLHLQEGPETVRQLRTWRVMVENTTTVGGWGPVASVPEAQAMIEVGTAAGREPPYACMEIPISPMRLNVELLSMLFQRRDREDQLVGIVVGGGAVPMPGATAPLAFPAAVSQALAEALGAYIIARTVDPRLHGYASLGGFLFNLRTMDTFHPYFPESLLVRSLIRDVSRRALGRTPGLFFKPDFYTNPGKLLQMGTRAAIDVLSGARSVHVGAEIGDVFCPLNAVIAADYLRHLQKLVEGLPMSRATSTDALVAEGLDDGMYLDKPSTLNYRALYTPPGLLFAHDDHASLMSAARKRMNELLGQPGYRLPEEARRRVDTICTQAESRLC